MSLLIGFLTLALVLVCLFMVMIILMQKARSDGGMGAAIGGGGAAESAFGAETSNILTRATIFCAVLFFLLTFSLYLIQQYRYHRSDRPVLPAGLPAIVDEEEPAPGIIFPGMDDFAPEEELSDGEARPEVAPEEETSAPVEESEETDASDASSEEPTPEISPESEESLPEPELDDN